MDTYVEDVLAHRQLVQDGLHRLQRALYSLENPLYHVCNILEVRGNIHDESKLSDEERPGYEIVVPRLRGLIYNSPEYKAALTEMGETLKQHYRENRHHPEHFPNGIEGMHLVDVMEMVCDWVAANARNTGGVSLQEMLTIQENRYKISDVLAEMITQTVALYLLPGVDAPPISDGSSLVYLTRFLCTRMAAWCGDTPSIKKEIELIYEDKQLVAILKNTLDWLSSLTVSEYLSF